MKKADSAHDTKKEREKAMEEKKRDYKKQSEWKKNNKDRINFEIPKGYKEKIKAAAGNKSLNMYILECIEQAERQTAGGTYADIKDLSAYARSAGCTEDEYIRQAIAEKMRRQDEEYTEEIEREKIF